MTSNDLVLVAIVVLAFLLIVAIMRGRSIQLWLKQFGKLIIGGEPRDKRPPEGPLAEHGSQGGDISHAKLAERATFRDTGPTHLTIGHTISTSDPKKSKRTSSRK